MSREALWTLVLLVSGGCGTGDMGDRQTTILDLDGDAVNGADVYDAECAACHGLNGEGNIGPSMAASVASNDEGQLVDVMLTGADGMPDFADLSDQDIADLVTYLIETY
jgi:mono/diheme cytochrome c family protein